MINFISGFLQYYRAWNTKRLQHNEWIRTMFEDPFWKQPPRPPSKNQ